MAMKLEKENVRIILGKQLDDCCYWEYEGKDAEKLIDVFMHLDRHIQNRDEYGICYTSDFVEAVEDVLEMLKKPNNVGSKWISVKDRLPEELPENQGKKVIQCLVSLKSTYPNGKPNTQKRQRQLQWYGAKGWKWEWSRICACRVTHWMPLPEPPTEESQPDCTYNKDGHCIGQKMMPECDPKNCDRRIER